VDVLEAVMPGHEARQHAGIGGCRARA
jgi:hypothetical protein